MPDPARRGPSAGPAALSPPGDGETLRDDAGSDTLADGPAVENTPRA
jgi:hypothetical protein